MKTGQRTALVSLGRLPKALDICRALSTAGWRVVVAEPFSWHLCRLSRSVARTYRVTAPNDDLAVYHDDMLRIVETEKVSLIVPVSEEIIPLSAVQPKLPEAVRFLGPSHDQLRMLHDKERFIERAQAAGLAVPETARLGTGAARTLAHSRDHVIKPVATCSGQGLRLCSAGEALPDPAALPSSIVQARLPGRHVSTFSIAHDGRVIGTVVYRGALFSGTVACAFERLEGEGEIESWVERFVEAERFSGMISFDFIDDDKGLSHAIECNPRVTSGIHFVESASLARALLDPQLAKGFKFKPHRLMQQFFPALTEVQASVFRRDGARQKFAVLRQAKDVNFAWSDPLPLWLQTFAAWPILARSIRYGESFGEASTFDIAFFGDGVAVGTKETETEMSG